MTNKIKEVDRFLKGLGNKFLSTVEADIKDQEPEANDFEFTAYEVREDGVFFKYAFFVKHREDVTDWFMSFDDLEKYDA